MKTLPVSTGDLWLLRSGQPGLISQAIEHILQGSAPRVIAAGIVLGSALATAWVGLAALGRAVTLRAVESYFPDEGASPPGNSRWGLGSLAGLNLLRVAITVAAGVGRAGRMAGCLLCLFGERPFAGVGRAHVLGGHPAGVAGMVCHELAAFLCHRIRGRRRGRHLRSDCVRPRLPGGSHRSSAGGEHMVRSGAFGGVRPGQFRGGVSFGFCRRAAKGRGFRREF